MKDPDNFDPNDRPFHNTINYDEQRHSFVDSHIAGDRIANDYNDDIYDDGISDCIPENELEEDDDPFGIGHDDYSADSNEGGPVPEILIAILDNAVRQLQEEMAPTSSRQTTSTILNTNTATSNITTATTSPEDLKRSRQIREHIEQTWKAVRTYWLWANDTPEERSIGARYRSETDGGAPLHLICKLSSHPPTDILREIVTAAPEVTHWEDSHGWLPLHHACIKGASKDVLELLVGVYPESLGAIDAHHRTPLHLYATRGTSDQYNPTTLATNFAILCAKLTSTKTSSIPSLQRHRNAPAPSPAKVRDTAGMLPMHYVCAYGTTTSVLRVLEEAFPESLEARDKNGRTPLHFAMVNAQRGASPAVLGFLLCTC